MTEGGCRKLGMRDRSECVSWPDEGFLLVHCMAGLSAPAEPEAGFHGQVQEMSGLAIDGPLTCQSPRRVVAEARQSRPCWMWGAVPGPLPRRVLGIGKGIWDRVLAC